MRVRWRCQITTHDVQTNRASLKYQSRRDIKCECQLEFSGETIFCCDPNICILFRRHSRFTRQSGQKRDKKLQTTLGELAEKVSTVADCVYMYSQICRTAPPNLAQPNANRNISVRATFSNQAKCARSVNDGELLKSRELWSGTDQTDRHCAQTCSGCRILNPSPVICCMCYMCILQHC